MRRCEDPQPSPLRFFASSPRIAERFYDTLRLACIAVAARRATTASVAALARRVSVMARGLLCGGSLALPVGLALWLLRWRRGGVVEAIDAPARDGLA